MELNVFFSGMLAGKLASTPDQGIVFAYDSAYLANPSNPAISISLPLRSESFSQKECMPFFSGLLPEGDVKHRVSEFLQISEASVLKFLQELGGECAGMISIIPEDKIDYKGDVFELDEENYEFLSEERLSNFIKNINTRPLLKAEDNLRLSLAGAQEKLPLAYFNKRFYLPQNNAPSTHLIKPTGQGELSTLAANEYICMKLASLCGIDVPEVELRTLAGDVFLLEKRYDRVFQNNTIKRLHQEDVCQAKGILSDHKYQNDGGPGIADVFSLLYSETTIPLVSTKKFLTYFIYNLIIGNCDAHGKNYSILYNHNSIELAPLYDCVCTLVYPNLTKKMSMKIGSHYEIQKVNVSNFYELANSLKIKPKYLIDLLVETQEKIQKNFQTLRDDKCLKEFQKFMESLEKIFSREILISK